MLDYQYDYEEAIKDDIREAIAENYDLHDYEDSTEAYDAIYDDLWIDDSVTGNASGSYTFNTYKAEEYLSHNSYLLAEALEEFGDNTPATVLIDRGAEYCDVTIRCYLLSRCLQEVLDEIYDDMEEEEASNE